MVWFRVQRLKTNATHVKPPLSPNCPCPDHQTRINECPLKCLYIVKELKKSSMVHHFSLSEDLKENVKEILLECQQDTEDLWANLPARISSHESSVEWEIVQMRTECPMSLIKVVPNGLSCFLCDEDFNRGAIHHKVEHLIAKHHEGVEPYQCRLCCLTFSNEKKAFSHNQLHHFLPEDFKDVTARNPEIKRIKGTSMTTYKCLRCDVVATSSLAYWYHCWTSHKKYRYASCPICQEKFRTSTEFRRHFLIEHFNFRYACPLCPLDFQSQTSINGHLGRCHVKASSKSPLTSLKRAVVDGDLSQKSQSSCQKGLGDCASIPLRKKKKEKHPKEGRSFHCDPNISRRARANSKIPLTFQERALVNADLCLKSPSPHQRGLGDGTFDPATQHLLELHHNLMKNLMPAIIDNQETLVSWLMLLNRVGEIRMLYGIPGETFCFECNNDFVIMSRLQMHILEKHQDQAP